MQRATLRKAIAWMIAVLSLVSTLFLAWWFLSLSVAVGDWRGLQRFADARHQAQLLRVALIALGIVVQITGGVAAGVALRVG